LRDAIGGLLEDRKLKVRLRQYSEAAASKPGSRMAAAEIVGFIR
jgi:hypothetical protein